MDHISHTPSNSIWLWEDNNSWTKPSWFSILDNMKWLSVDDGLLSMMSGWMSGTDDWYSPTNKHWRMSLKQASQRSYLSRSYNNHDLDLSIRRMQTNETRECIRRIDELNNTGSCAVKIWISTLTCRRWKELWIMKQWDRKKGRISSMNEITDSITWWWNHLLTLLL